MVLQQGQRCFPTVPALCRLSGEKPPLEDGPGAVASGAFYWAPNDWTKWNATYKNNFVYDSGTTPLLCNDQTSCVRAAFYNDDGNAGEQILDNLLFFPFPNFTTPAPPPGKGYNDPSTYHLMAIFNDGGRNMRTENNLIVDAPVAACGNAASIGGVDAGWLQSLRDVRWRDPPFSVHYPALAKFDDFVDREGAPACADRSTCPAAPYGMTSPGRLCHFDTL